jgi:hypothetical protein
MLKIKKLNHKKIKCFQVNWISWSNLYLGNVPRIKIPKRVTQSVLKNNMTYVKRW